MTAQLFEIFRVNFERITVPPRIVKMKGRRQGISIGSFRIITETGRERRGINRESEIITSHTMRYSPECHTRTVGLAVSRVSGYMGGSQKSPAKKFPGDFRLILPSIDDSLGHLAVRKGTKQGCGIAHLTSAAIDKYGTALHLAEKEFIRQMIGRKRTIDRQRSMAGYDIRLARQIFHRGGTGRSFPLSSQTWRIAQQWCQPQAVSHRFHAAADMSYADDTDPALPQVYMSDPIEEKQSRLDILSHTVRITSRTIGPTDPRRVEVTGVKMVIAYRGRCNELYPTAGQQRSVATGTGTDNQCLGIAYILRRYLTAGYIPYRAETLGLATDKGNLVVDNNHRDILK